MSVYQKLYNFSIFLCGIVLVPNFDTSFELRLEIDSINKTTRERKGIEKYKKTAKCLLVLISSN